MILSRSQLNMELVKPLENLDSIVCEKHNGNIILLSLEKTDNIRDQLLCVDCIEEKTRITYSLPWKDVKTLIQEQQQNQFHEDQIKLKPLLDLIELMGKIIDSIKQNLISKLEDILSTKSDWVKQINDQQNKGRQYSVFKELETFIKKQQKTEINSFIDSRIRECNQYHLLKIKGQFKQISLSLDFQSLSDTISQIFAFMENDILKVSSYEQKIKCICSEHQKEITMINLDRGVFKEKRALCKNCQVQNGVTTQNFEERWMSYQEALQQKRFNKQQNWETDILLVKQRMLKLNEYTNNQTQQIVNFMKMQRNLFNRTHHHCKQLTLQQLQINADELSLNEIEKRLINNKEYNKEIQQLSDQIQTIIQQLNNSLKIEIDDLIAFSKTMIAKINSKAIKYEQTDEISQNGNCCAVAFNKDGTIMVASCVNEIKIWKLENGKLQLSTTLSEHNKQVYCLVFSKNNNWFVSGSHDQSIRCWKEMQDNRWASSQNYNQHSDYILCLLLNKNEDYLFSCSADKSIKVWKADYKNKLIYDCSLDKHTGWVCCISLNQQNNQLVSCSLDKQIILWCQDLNEKWQFKYVLLQSVYDVGYRVCFIDDNIIAWQQNSQGITHIFKMVNGIFMEKQDLKIIQNQMNEDAWLFPSVYNKERQILIQKHNKYIYIMRYLNDGIFEKEQKFIDCNSQMTYGGLTPDGKTLAIWNQQTKQFRIYRIEDE